jgi:hypothetical protein
MTTIALVDKFATTPGKQPIITELALGESNLKIVYKSQSKYDRVLNTLQDTLALTERYLDRSHVDAKPEFIDRTSQYFQIEGDRLYPINHSDRLSA